jgi:anti-sigma factor RsiW
MDHHTTLQLQAYLDGELPENEVCRIETWLEEDSQARALLSELEGTRTLLSGYQDEVPHPESREFFWSKIERAIRAQEIEAPAVRPSRLAPLAAWWKYLVPAGSLASLLFASLLVTRGPGGSGGPEWEAALNDPGALTYRDFASGTTLVWLSFPAENELADEDRTDSDQ